MLFTLFLAWIIAVSCMTGFSYLLSGILKQNFKEPLLLVFLLDAFFNGKIQQWVGWLAHYLTGIFFLLLLMAAYSITNVPVSVPWGLVFGGILGGIGIMMWKGLYKLTNTDPPTHTRLFHLQLIVAHIVFGMAAIWVHSAYAPYLKIFIG